MAMMDHGPRASSEEMTRLAVNPDWGCNIHDPRNARYLRPLSTAADEGMANMVAEAIYGVEAEQHANDRTFDSDEVYRQCLVNSRRMLCDREYWGLFANDKDFPARSDASSQMILVEGPDWQDAAFFGNWLLAVAEVDRLHQEAVRADPQYHEATQRLKVLSELSFGWTAMYLIKELGADGVTIAICDDCLGAEYIAMMSQMGFFTQTGNRYQMTIPSQVDVQIIKRSILALAETEDSNNVFHTEAFVTSLPCSEVEWWQDVLGRMNQEQRLSDRAMLLD